MAAQDPCRCNFVGVYFVTRSLQLSLILAPTTCSPPDRGRQHAVLACASWKMIKPAVFAEWLQVSAPGSTDVGKQFYVTSGLFVDTSRYA